MTEKRARTAKTEPVQVLHRGGSLWATGQDLDGQRTGFRIWFRKYGTKLRSGHFENGAQIGEWTTCDKQVKVHKITKIKPKHKK